jgi:hypothetical protein
VSAGYQSHRVCFASPLDQGERIKVRGSSPPSGTTRWEQPSPSPSPFAHSFALTGAGASVSPKRERAEGEATLVCAIGLNTN